MVLNKILPCGLIGLMLCALLVGGIYDARGPVELPSGWIVMKVNRLTGTVWVCGGPGGCRELLEGEPIRPRR